MSFFLSYRLRSCSFSRSYLRRFLSYLHFLVFDGFHLFIGNLFLDSAVLEEEIRLLFHESHHCWYEDFYTMRLTAAVKAANSLETTIEIVQLIEIAR